MSLKDEFDEVALNVYEDTKVATGGYTAVRYLQKVKKDGGVAAAKSWLNPKKAKTAPTGGFLLLAEHGKLDVSLEAQVVKPKWRRLFTEEELAVARMRLERYAQPARVSKKRKESLISEEQRFVEGDTVNVTVNKHERNPKARKACISHYGATCYVCSLDFAECYGPLAAGIIHVHHLFPMASCGGTREVDPIADLRPVCPNCHAVIHQVDPPRLIDEVKRMIHGHLSD